MRTAKPLLLFVVLLLTAACIHKAGTAVTPWERVHTYNAALAEANNALERGAEAVVTSGLAPAAEMAPIINCSGQVALVHQQVTAILAQGQATSANVTAIQHMVGVIKGSIANLPPSALGLKNPKSQQAFQADVANVAALADALLAALQAVGGTP